MDRKTVQVAILSCAAGAAVMAVAVLLMPKPEVTKPVASAPVAPKPAPEVAKPAPAEPDPASVVVARPEVDISEFKYLPQEVSIKASGTSPLLNPPTMISSGRRAMNVRPLTDKSKQGEFLSPRWSPDGLMIIASRPGYDGLYVIDAQTGESRRIADGSSFNASWNPDGTIDVKGEDGTTRTYDAEGTLLASKPTEARSGPVYAEQDTIFARTEEGGVVPLTGNDDRYFNPVLSPDGKHLIYEGLVTGLYMVPVDGSSAPVYIGKGNNPQWMPDSSGVVFDVTADDGHHLTEGDLFFVDRGQSERTNLTPGDALISQRPSVDPSGNRLAFESDGTIYVGEVR